MLIREATERDLPEILELLKDMDGEEGIPLGQARTIWCRINEYPYYKIFIAQDDNIIIGTCSLIIIDNLGHNGIKMAVAENMIVGSRFRGCGVGKQIIKFIMERAKEERSYKLILSSNKKRVNAHRFYEQLGFEQHGLSFMIDCDNHAG